MSPQDLKRLIDQLNPSLGLMAEQMRQFDASRFKELTEAATRLSSAYSLSAEMQGTLSALRRPFPRVNTEFLSSLAAIERQAALPVIPTSILDALDGLTGVQALAQKFSADAFPAVRWAALLTDAQRARLSIPIVSGTDAGSNGGRKTASADQPLGGIIQNPTGTVPDSPTSAHPGSSEQDFLAALFVTAIGAVTKSKKRVSHMEWFMALLAVATLIQSLSSPLWNKALEGWLASAAAPAAPQIVGVRIDERRALRALALRLNPRMRSPEVGRLRPGQVVTVVQAGTNWTMVEVADGSGGRIAGWALSRYLEKVR